jgi:hypothetical protein
MKQIFIYIIPTGGYILILKVLRVIFTGGIMKAKVIRDRFGNIIIEQSNNASYKFGVSIYKFTFSFEKESKIADFPYTLDYQENNIEHYIDNRIFIIHKREL